MEEGEDITAAADSAVVSAAAEAEGSADSVVDFQVVEAHQGDSDNK